MSLSQNLNKFSFTKPPTPDVRRPRASTIGHAPVRPRACCPTKKGHGNNNHENPLMIHTHKRMSKSAPCLPKARSVGRHRGFKPEVTIARNRSRSKSPKKSGTIFSPRSPRKKGGPNSSVGKDRMKENKPSDKKRVTTDQHSRIHYSHTVVVAKVGFEKPGDHVVMKRDSRSKNPGYTSANSAKHIISPRESSDSENCSDKMYINFLAQEGHFLCLLS